MVMTLYAVQVAIENRMVWQLARRMDTATSDDFDKLVRECGRTAAGRIWARACASYDWHNAPEEFPDGRPSGVVEW